MSQELQQRDAQGFWRMLWHLLVLLRPFPAVFLVLLSVAEAMIVARGTLWIRHRLCVVKRYGGTAYFPGDQSATRCCSWASRRTVLPHYCGSATLNVCKDHLDVFDTIHMQHNCQVNKSVAVRTAFI